MLSSGKGFIYLLNWFSIFCVFFVSCNNKEPLKSPNYFFDLKGYTEKQIDELTHSAPYVEKLIVNASTKEMKKNIKVNWRKELQPLMEADINKPAWKDSYKVDSLFSKDSLVVKYLAKDSTLSIKKIIIIYKDSIASIYILKKISNLIYSSFQEIFYYPKMIFQISGYQDIILIGKRTYFIRDNILMRNKANHTL